MPVQKSVPAWALFLSAGINRNALEECPEIGSEFYNGFGKENAV
jgi:hypothetical protein